MSIATTSWCVEVLGSPLPSSSCWIVKPGVCIVAVHYPQSSLFARTPQDTGWWQSDLSLPDELVPDMRWHALPVKEDPLLAQYTGGRTRNCLLIPGTRRGTSTAHTRYILTAQLGKAARIIVADAAKIVPKSRKPHDILATRLIVSLLVAEPKISDIRVLLGWFEAVPASQLPSVLPKQHEAIAELPTHLQCALWKTASTLLDQIEVTRRRRAIAWRNYSLPLREIK